MAYLGFTCLVNCSFAFCKQLREHSGEEHVLSLKSALKNTKRERIVRSRCVSMPVIWVSGSALLTWLRCGLTLAESPRAVDVLLAHITRTSPLEALLRKGMAPCFGKLQHTQKSNLIILNNQINRNNKCYNSKKIQEEMKHLIYVNINIIRMLYLIVIF